MAELAFESMSAEAREKERNDRRIWLRDMPRQTEEQQFLADSVQAWTDVRERAENNLLVVKAAAAGKAPASPEVELLVSQRKMLETINTWVKRTGLAARDGMKIALELFMPHHMESQLTEEEAKQYKAIRRKREEEKKAVAAAAAGYIPGGRRDRGNPYGRVPDLFILQQQQQLAAYAAAKGIPAAAGGESSSGAASGTPATGANAAPAHTGGGLSARQRFPCKSCDKMGHWMRDGLCKPEDVATAVAKRIAYYQGQTGGSSGSGKVVNKRLF